MIACPEGLDPKNICVDAKESLRQQGLSRTETELETLFRDVHPIRSAREVPISTVIRRLGLDDFNKAAYFKEVKIEAKKVCIPLNSHIGKNAQAIVKTGQQVIKGQKIGDVSQTDMGCPVHASIDGTIDKIDTLGIHIKA